MANRTEHTGASADALEGDEYLNDFVAGDSDEEEVAPADLEDDGEQDTTPVSRKRKASEEPLEEKDTTTAAEETAPKKKKKDHKDRPKKQKKDWSLDPRKVLEEEGIPLKDCRKFEKTGDEHFAEFIRDYLFAKSAAKLFTQDPKIAVGSPAVIVLSASAIRAVNVARLMRKVGECKVAKLFAKHLKLKDQVDALSKDRFPIAVGTPNRVLKLIEDGALKLDDLKYVIADSTFKDQKQRGIFDVPELKMDNFTLLRHIRDKAESAEICLY
ncbi:U3-containing 90S pre-ribosomal complex subunit-domain containing protein [Fimicolochytrium jonesii]|uniref:U3-containing 90S pre-ribosomal complex subunit-domain containing protein n=1 Tax=Fimicolochytrium jonesii TaxID=1396493 RepID=UPI0022FF0EE6|nr:U3-containing 90S pre-ribosomal complex subunit-domain containing protein [Fimicolochytrium jonesii]KAI8816673.1 U3-containing 90S pre-ribosomal complex subunit-domain containing protein [Fimicolochytrium jonesii]